MSWQSPFKSGMYTPLKRVMYGEKTPLLRGLRVYVRLNEQPTCLGNKKPLGNALTRATADYLSIFGIMIPAKQNQLRQMANRINRTNNAMVNTPIIKQCV